MRRLSAAGWLAALAAGGVWWALGSDLRTLATSLSGTDLPAALAATASLAAIVVASWILVVVTLIVVAPGASRRIAPDALYRSFARRAAVAGAISVLSFSSAHADSGYAVSSGTPASSVNGLRLPDRPVTTINQAPQPSPHAEIVRAGDTLWAIAARHLSPDATHADIARAVADWYHTNRATIGDDPDLIHPEQVLNPPKDRP